MRLFGKVDGTIDRFDMPHFFGGPFDLSMEALAYAVRVDAAEIFVAGASDGEIFISGVSRGECLIGGADAAEVMKS